MSHYLLSDGDHTQQITVGDAMGQRLDLRAFGQNLSILAPKIDFLCSDSLWRLRHIYQPALATQTLDSAGVALDIGAGFGAFALPFAMAFPKWRVFCFEPDPLAFQFLLKNISDLSLTQVTALPFAIGSQKTHSPKDPSAVRLALENLGAGLNTGGDGLSPLLPVDTFSKSQINIGYLEYGCNDAAEFESVQAPILAAAMLDILNPRLLKLTAPKVEADIVSDLSDARIDHVIGESWGHIPSGVIHNSAAVQRHIWFPRAGQAKLALRGRPVADGRQSRLDIVLALSSEVQDLSCLAALLEDPSVDIKILVVGNAPDAIRIYAKSDPRICVYETANQGQSAAWNFGRLHSTATHLAFIDAKSFPQRAFFSRLFDLACQTGAEVVQGPYRLSETGYPIADTTAQSAYFEFADTPYQRLNAPALMAAPPSISRRVYRRDFLDNRAIFFPKGAQPFAHYVFQTLSLNHLADVPDLSGATLIQQAPPPDQAINTLDAFRFLLERAKTEGWFDLSPLLQSFQSQAQRTAANLTSQERLHFLQSAAEISALLNELMARSEQ